MRYFDAHCHVQFPQFDEDRDALLSSMEQHQLGGIVVGVDADSSQKAITLVEHSESLFAAVGLHPNYTQDEAFGDELRALAEHHKVVAIGECGLDHYRPEDVAGAKDRQKEVFLQHIELSVRLGKPLMIHARPAKGTQDAYRDLIDMLQSAKREHGDRLLGNIHFFVGGLDEARALLALDFTLSYTAVLTFTHDYDEVVRFAPMTHLLSETDAPYVAPAPNRGKRNDPIAVEQVVAAIAGIRGEEEELVRLQILENVERVFKLSSALR